MRRCIMRGILLLASGCFFLASLYMLYSSGWTFGTEESLLGLLFFLWSFLTALFWHYLVLCAKVEKLEALLDKRKQELGVLAEHH